MAVIDQSIREQSLVLPVPGPGKEAWQEALARTLTEIVDHRERARREEERKTSYSYD